MDLMSYFRLEKGKYLASYEQMTDNKTSNSTYYLPPPPHADYHNQPPT